MAARTNPKARWRWSRWGATLLLGVGLTPMPTVARELAYVVSSVADIVTVIDTGDFAVVATIPVVYDALDVAASPDGRTVVVGGREGLSVIDTSSNRVVSTIPVDHRLRGLTFSPSGDLLYAAADARAYIEIDVAAGRVERVVPFSRDTLAIVVSGDGDTLYVVHEDAAGEPAGIAIVDAASGAVRSDTVFGVFTPGPPALPPLSTLLYVPVGGRQGLVEMDAIRGTQVGLLDLGGPQSCVVSDSAGTLLYASDENSIHIVDRASGENVRSLGVETPQCGFAVGSDGRVFAVSTLFSALLVLEPDDLTVDTPLIAAVPVAPLAESVAIAEVPSSSGGGGCAVGGTDRASGCLGAAGVMLLLGPLSGLRRHRRRARYGSSG